MAVLQFKSCKRHTSVGIMKVQKPLCINA